MKMEVSVLEEKEYGGNTILFPTNVEIETNDICVNYPINGDDGFSGKSRQKRR